MKVGNGVAVAQPASGITAMMRTSSFGPKNPNRCTPAEQRQRLDELHEQWNSYDSHCDETDALEAEIDAIEQAAEISAWGV